MSRRREEQSASEAIELAFPAATWRASWPSYWPRITHVTLLLLTDMLALLSAVSLGYVLWAWLMLDQLPSVYIELMPLLLLFPLGYAGVGLYPGFGVGAVETLRRMSCCTSFAFLILAAASFALKVPAHYSRMSFAIAWGVSLIVVPLLRFLLLAVARRWEWWGEPAVLIGRGQWVQWTIRSLENALSLGYRPKWVLSSDVSTHGRIVEGVPVLGGPELAAYLAERGIRVALVSDGRGHGDSSPSWFQQHFRHVIIIRDHQDLPVERARVCNLGGVLGIEFTNNLLRWPNRLVKRLLDLTLGSLLLALALPLIACGGLLAKLLSRGPFFFSQTREGQEGRLIRVWKLRTMYQDAEQRLKTFLAVNPELRRQWEERFKLTDDPRIIPGIGLFLRRFSIDELPQLWNVVIGEMSLVGPRPFPEYHLQEFSPEFRGLRRGVRPGLTGMWQVMVRSDGDIEAQQVHDTYYIRNWSIWLDLWILFRTGWAVLVGKGAR